MQLLIFDLDSSKLLYSIKKNINDKAAAIQLPFTHFWLGEIAYRVSPDWTASLTIASRPWSHAHGRGDALNSALEELDAPAVALEKAKKLAQG